MNFIEKYKIVILLDIVALVINASAAIRNFMNGGIGISIGIFCIFVSIGMAIIGILEWRYVNNQFFYERDYSKIKRVVSQLAADGIDHDVYLIKPQGVFKKVLIFHNEKSFENYYDYLSDDIAVLVTPDNPDGIIAEQISPPIRNSRICMFPNYA